MFFGRLSCVNILKITDTLTNKAPTKTCKMKTILKKRFFLNMWLTKTGVVYFANVSDVFEIFLVIYWYYVLLKVLHKTWTIYLHGHCVYDSGCVTADWVTLEKRVYACAVRSSLTVNLYQDSTSELFKMAEYVQNIYLYFQNILTRKFNNRDW